MARFNDGAAMTNVVKCTRLYLDSILAEERLIDAVEPDLSFELFGERQMEAYEYYATNPQCFVADEELEDLL